jgi:membrane-bound lytic murein transglycosylase A
VKSVAHVVLTIVISAVILFSGCKKPEQPISQIPEPKKDYGTPLPPGELALRKIDPSRYPDFSSGYVNRPGLEEAIRNSISYLGKPSSRQYFPYLDISHDRAMKSCRAMLDVLQQARSPVEFDAMIKDRFEVYQSVGCDDRGTVLFTGYYRPIFDARLQPDSQFRYPLYKAPTNLVKDNDGNTKGMKTPAGAVIPCWTRGEIEGRQPLKGQEICWLKDRFEAYIVTVQGSGKLRLADRSYFEIGYAANNGFDYTSVGQKLISDGAIQAEQLSLRGLIDYFRAHPEQMDRYLSLNRRYVFFQPRSGGPYGSLNESVTPYRSIATDKSIYPRACPAFFQTQLPVRLGDDIQNQPYGGFAMDQDTGGAIRAAGRCDIFMGTDDDKGSVGELAGRTFSEGQLYYVFVKEGGAGSAVTVASPAPTTPAPPQQ